MMRLSPTATPCRRVLFLLALLPLACATPPRNPFTTPDGTRGPVYVEVDNGLDLSIGVYAVRGTSRFRVGSVPSLSRRTLKVPAHLMAPGMDVQLMADPVGSRTAYWSQALVVPLGSRIVWPIVPGLELSQATVRH